MGEPQWLGPRRAMAAIALGPGPFAYTDGVADGLVVWLFCLAVLPGRFALAVLPGRLPGPLAWPSGPVLWAGPLGRSSGLVLWAGPLVWSFGLAFFWRRLRLADAGTPAGRGFPSGSSPQREARWIGIYSQYTRHILWTYSQLRVGPGRCGRWPPIRPRTREPARLPASCAWERGFPWCRGCHERRLST